MRLKACKSIDYDIVKTMVFSPNKISLESSRKKTKKLYLKTGLGRFV